MGDDERVEPCHKGDFGQFGKLFALKLTLNSVRFSDSSAMRVDLVPRRDVSSSLVESFRYKRVAAQLHGYSTNSKAR